jgi:hypothetical protein
MMEIIGCNDIDKNWRGAGRTKRLAGRERPKVGKIIGSLCSLPPKSSSPAKTTLGGRRRRSASAFGNDGIGSSVWFYGTHVDLELEAPQGIHDDIIIALSNPYTYDL